MWVERLTQLVRAVAIIGGALLITFLALPSPTKSSAWQPPRAPNLEGAFAANDVLLNADRVAPGLLVGPDDVVVDVQGRVYAGTVDGKVVRTRMDGSLEMFTETNGRPLGMTFGPSGDLYVADPIRGLLRVDSEGHIEVLAHEVEGNLMLFTNDVTVASDGVVYFTDSSLKWGYGAQLYDILEQNPTGRLLRWDPRTRQTTVLLRGLAFANGIALAADETYLLVSETSRYRLTRFWLQGDKRNMSEPFMDNLPGFPDNLTLTERGTWWVALNTVRKTLLDRLHPYPLLKDRLTSLPTAVWTRSQAYGLVFEVDAEGRVLRTLQDPTGRRFKDVSSVIEHEGVVYIGTLSGTAIGRAVPPPLPR